MDKLIFARLTVPAFTAALCILPAKADEMTDAISLYQRKDYLSATRMFMKASQKSNTGTADYYLALCYLNLGLKPQAAEQFRRVVKYWPDSKEAELAGQYLRQANSQEQKSAVQHQTTTSTPAPPKKKTSPNARENITLDEWKTLPQKTRIPFLYEKGHMMVQAKVNGRYVKLVFDTGATSCSISQHDFPGLIPASELRQARVEKVSRPHGIAEMRVCTAEISLQDITRKVRVLVTTEPGVSLIGQNFFKEYDYEIDNFYIRLTKAPYEEESANAEESDAKKHVASNPASSVAGAVPKNETVKRDKYSVPFTRMSDVMLVDIEVNGRTIQACFDTGCAPDGIVMNPYVAQRLGVQRNSDGPHFERLTIGPVTRTYVKVYPAAMPVPLIGPKIFGDRPYTVDQKNRCIRFQY